MNFRRVVNISASQRWLAVQIAILISAAILNVVVVATSFHSPCRGGLAQLLKAMSYERSLLARFTFATILR